MFSMQDFSEPFIMQVDIRNLQRWSLETWNVWMSETSVQRSVVDSLANLSGGGAGRGRVGAREREVSRSAPTLRNAESGGGALPPNEGLVALSTPGQNWYLHNTLLMGQSFPSRMIYLGFQ